MLNNSETSEVDHTLHLGPRNPDGFSWRSAVLGAAVGIAGPAYFGTLIFNVNLQLLLAQGKTISEAYAQLGIYELSIHFVTALIANICSAMACGAVSAAYGRGRHVTQGMVAGVLAITFPLIMLLGPDFGTVPRWARALAFLVPLVGSVAGAYLYSRKI